VTYQHHQALAACDAGVEQVPLQHGVVLGQHRDDDRGILGPLALVDGRGIGRHQRVEFPKSVGDGTAVEAGGEFAGIGIDIVDVADVAIVDFLDRGHGL
jgi:hypothetical protein